jgi:hypothetical protein
VQGTGGSAIIMLGAPSGEQFHPGTFANAGTTTNAGQPYMNISGGDQQRRQRGRIGMSVHAACALRGAARNRMNLRGWVV